MGDRRGARTWALQLLFQWDFNPLEEADALEEFWREKDPSERGRRFAEDLYRGVTEHRDAIDRVLQGYADNWDLRRMSAVDRNVMRIALYEMWHRQDIPPVVTINEAVEISKAYSGPESGKFVNGILDRARKDLDRPARTAATQAVDVPLNANAPDVSASTPPDSRTPDPNE
jgi:N utilization substance protein B